MCMQRAWFCIWTTRMCSKIQKKALFLYGYIWISNSNINHIETLALKPRRSQGDMETFGALCAGVIVVPSVLEHVGLWQYFFHCIRWRFSPVRLPALLGSPEKLTPSAQCHLDVNLNAMHRPLVDRETPSFNQQHLTPKGTAGSDMQDIFMLAVPYASKSAFMFACQAAVGTLEASRTFVVGISVAPSEGWISCSSKGLANLAASTGTSGTEVSDSMSCLMDAQKSKTSDVKMWFFARNFWARFRMVHDAGKTLEILENIQ